jgi:hypothetical protein
MIEINTVPLDFSAQIAGLKYGETIKINGVEFVVSQPTAFPNELFLCDKQGKCVRSSRTGFCVMDRETLNTVLSHNLFYVG